MSKPSKYEERRSQLRLDRAAEIRYSAFKNHALLCGICGASEPDPESSPAGELCEAGRGLRRIWERAEKKAAEAANKPAGGPK